MQLSKISVNKPTTTIIIFLLLIGLGLYAALNLPIDLYPNINMPVLLIFTDYKGNGPEEIEKMITRPLENVLSNVGNVDKIHSISNEDTSQIMIYFTWGTNMDEAANDVRDKIEYIKGYLPDGAESPMIFKFDPSMIPVMFLSLTGNRTPEELRDIGEKIIQPKLEQVDGVSMANINGGRERAIRVEILQNRLQAYNLNLTQISNILSSQNVQISAGSIGQGNKNYLIRTAGEYQNIEEIKNTVIAYKTGYIPAYTGTIDPTKVIRLRDIANVYDGLKKEEEATYVDGIPSVEIVIQKQSGKNSVKTVDNVFYKIYRERNNAFTRIRKKLDKFFNIRETVKPGSLLSELPPDIKLDVLYDNTVLIRKSLQEVGGTALSGAILAILILFVFLRSLKAVTIIGLSIPISIVITLSMMYFFGFTLNIMTLAGLALGIGRLVDDSIVILDNIYRYREKGTKLTTAAVIGSQEMMNAIMASSLTTICVFAPVVLFRSQLGMYGELFSGLAFTVVFSLTTSIFTAIFLTPVLASKYLPISSQLERNLTGFPKKFDDTLSAFFRGLEGKYMGLLRIVLKKRKITIGIIAGIFIVSLFMAGMVGFQLAPKSDEDSVQLEIELPVGTRLDITKDVARQFEEIIKTEIKGYKNIVTQVGEKSFYGFLGNIMSNKANIQIILADDPNKRPVNSLRIQEILRKHFNDFPSVSFSFPSGGHAFGGSASPIDLLVKSSDLTRAKMTAEKIRTLIREKVPEAVEPMIDMTEGLPQVEIVIDRQRAYALGLNMNSIGQEVRANVDGVVSSQYRDKGDEYDIVVIADPKDMSKIINLEKIFVINNAGLKIPVASFARLSDDTEGPVSIKRENQKRTVHITANLGKGAVLNNVQQKIDGLIKSEIPQDDDLSIEFSGDFADMMEYGLKLLMLLLLCVILVFGVMASQFESFLDPFIILFTIPLTITGVIWIHLLTLDPFNIFTIVGLIVLVGIVVSNGIVFVDYTNILMKRGYGIFDACIEAGRHRLRPILMTSLATILGLLPMAITKVEGTEMSRAIGKTMFGGMAVSSIFTLVLIPVMYSIFKERAQKMQAKKALKRQKQLEIRKEKLSRMQ